jgi:hypothetical protein
LPFEAGPERVIESSPTSARPPRINHVLSDRTAEKESTACWAEAASAKRCTLMSIHLTSPFGGSWQAKV